MNDVYIHYVYHVHADRVQWLTFNIYYYRRNNYIDFSMQQSYNCKYTINWSSDFKNVKKKTNTIITASSTQCVYLSK